MKSLQNFQVPAPEESFGRGNRRVIVGFAVRPRIGRISERSSALKETPRGSGELYRKLLHVIDPAEDALFEASNKDEPEEANFR